MSVIQSRTMSVHLMLKISESDGQLQADRFRVIVAFIDEFYLGIISSINLPERYKWLIKPSAINSSDVNSRPLK